MIKDIDSFGLWHSYLKETYLKRTTFLHIKVKSRTNRHVFEEVQYLP